VPLSIKKKDYTSADSPGIENDDHAWLDFKCKKILQIPFILD